MSYGLVNLTLPMVTQEIENVLEEYPEHPYQFAFSLPELRRKLVDHIFSSFPNYYASKESEKPFSNGQVHRTSPLQERLRLELVVRGSILHILRENADWLSRHLPKV